MGAADLRTAFNSVTGAKFSCAQATMGYEQANGIQWQRLVFSGTSADGTPFEVRSDRLRPETDLVAAAKGVAQTLLAKSQQQPPATGG